MNIFKDIFKERFGINEAICFDDVIIIPGFSSIDSRQECDTSQPYMDFPVFSSPMDTITGIEMRFSMQQRAGVGILHRYMPEDQMLNIMLAQQDLNTNCAAVGLLKTDQKRIDLLIDNIKKNLWLCVDVAYGFTNTCADTVKYIKDRNPDVVVIAGNVATPDGAKFLEDAGANLVRVGIGGGSVCSTRIKTGCGLPTLTSILWCKKEGVKVPIIADGGIRNPGDVCKSLVAGAHSVMIGGMLAGTDSTPQWNSVMKTYNGGPMPRISYRGMASAEARRDFGKDPVNAEGVAKSVICKPPGSTLATLTYIEEGIKSSMSYVGARTLKEYRAQALLVRVSQASIAENHPHFEDK